MADSISPSEGPNGGPSGEVVRTALIGCGRVARGHISAMLAQQDTTRIVAVSEPSIEAYGAAAELFRAAGLEPPPNIPNLERLLMIHGSELDTAFVMTPHAYHYAQTVACMEAGLDVLLEKPMVISGAEAEGLIQVRDRTDRLLVVAFPGSLSPHIRTAVNLLRSGELGPVLTITGHTWEYWSERNIGTWRHVPEIAGGGFFFDTGAHLLNTTADLAGEDFVEVAAWLDNRDTPVDVLGVAMARLASGALVSFSACGDSSMRARSEIVVCCPRGTIRTGIWGERLELHRFGEDDLKPVSVPESLGVWQQFLAVRDGRLPNPCPPEVGLRMAHLWDAIKASSAQGGVPVRVGEAAQAAATTT